MTERPIPPTDEELGLLAALGADGAGDALDDELIAALAEGLLPPEQQTAAERTLLVSDDSRTRLAEMVDTLPTEAEATEARPILGLAIAALLLLTVGAAVYAAALGTDATGGSDAALLRAAAELQEAEPELFAAFRPLDAGERANGAASVERSALRIVRPGGLVLSQRPWIEWTLLPGASTYALRIQDENGDTVADETSSTTPYRFSVELVRGAHYVVEVSTEGPFGPVTARRAYRVATTEEAATIGAQREAVGRIGGPEIRQLLLAHVYLRQDLLVEAELALTLHLYSFPHDTVAGETMDHVRRRLGIAGD